MNRNFRVEFVRFVKKPFVRLKVIAVKWKKMAILMSSNVQLWKRINKIFLFDDVDDLEIKILHDILNLFLGLISFVKVSWVDAKSDHWNIFLTMSTALDFWLRFKAINERWRKSLNFQTQKLSLSIFFLPSSSFPLRVFLLQS